jgi:hypothetical protein
VTVGAVPPPKARRAGPGRPRLRAGLALTALIALGAAAQGTPPLAPDWQARLEQGGVVAQVELRAAPGRPLRAGEPAHLRVTLTRAVDGSALPRLLPAVWLDAQDPAPAAAPAATDAAPDTPAPASALAAATSPTDCARRIARHARGTGISPQALVDLNGYDVLALNADASISVLDPQTQFAGRTSLRATLPLPGPGFDWAADAADRQLWVTVPALRSVALLDLAALRSLAQLTLPGAPGRVRVEPGTGRAWIGVPSRDAMRGGAPGGAPGAVPGGVSGGEFGVESGGVAVVEPQPPHRQHWIGLSGQGHVDLAFDPEGWVAITQRGSDEVVFVDPTTLQVVQRQRLGVAEAQPLHVVFDAPARRFIVAEARRGELHAFDHRGQALPRLALAPGIGPMALSPDGRWLLLPNPGRHRVHVVDLPAWQARHELPVSGRPYDIGLSSGYAYVRALDSEAVALVGLASLATAPRVQAVVLGERAPGRTPHLPLASALVAMPDGRGHFVASPGDNAVFVYMEGMNAAAGSVSARGHELRAVRLARRGLRETAPGVHEAELTLPAAPQLVLALGTESPRTRQCAPLTVLAAAAPAPAWQLVWDRFPAAADGTRLELRLEGAPPDRLPAALPVRLFQPGAAPLVLHARRGADGRYAADVPELEQGLWYAHPQTPPGAGTVWPYASFIREPRHGR